MIAKVLRLLWNRAPSRGPTLSPLRRASSTKRRSDSQATGRTAHSPTRLQLLLLALVAVVSPLVRADVVRAYRGPPVPQRATGEQYLRPLLRPASVKPSARLQREYIAAARRLGQTIGDFKHLNRSLSRKLVVSLNTVEQQARNQLGARVAVHGITQIKGSQCRIRLNPSGWHVSPSARQVYLAQQVFHCFQLTLNPHAAPWIQAGQAEWVGQVVGGPDPVVERQVWAGYLDQPSTNLFKRADTAIGFYSHLAESKIDPWRVFDVMLRQSTDTSAFGVAVNAAGPEAAETFLDSWASGYFREAGRGTAWDTHGPAMPSPLEEKAKVNTVPIGNGTVLLASEVAYANKIYMFQSTADIVHAEPSGFVRISGGPGGDLNLRDGADFCTRPDGCTCPPGSHYTGPDLVPLGSGAYVALTGGTDGAQLSLTGVSLEKYCDKDPTPKPGPVKIIVTMPDPCELLPQDEALALIGTLDQKVVTNGVEIRVCGYYGKKDAGPYGVAQLSVLTDALVAISGQDVRAGDPVPYVGDEAYVHTETQDDSTLLFLWVRSRTLWVNVYVVWKTGSVSNTDAEGVATTIARNALARIAAYG